jgi:hypothetical protein
MAWEGNVARKAPPSGAFLWHSCLERERQRRAIDCKMKTPPFPEAFSILV